MRVIFFGTPETAAPYLSALARRHTVAAAVTQMDKPAGRGLATEPTPVKKLALSLGIPVLQPAGASEIAARLQELKPDLSVVVAYGKLLKSDVLAVPRIGTLNVHFSLLPKYRGAAPVQWALARGETRTGVTLFWLDEGMDTGPVFLSRACEIGADEDAPALLRRLTALGVASLDEALCEIEAGRVLRVAQSGETSLAPRIKKEDARIDLGRPARAIHDLVRGMRLWPRGYLDLSSGRLLVLKTALAADEAGPGPGAIVRVERDKGFLVQCGGRSCLWFIEVQPEGKKPIPAADFLNGLRLGPKGFLPLA